MRLYFSRSNPLFKGTIILTITSLMIKLLGFFYRMYLSRVFGAESVGIYQLMAPVLAITYCICVSGIQTAISKLVSSIISTSKASAYQVLQMGLFLSLILSLFIGMLTYCFSNPIAKIIFKETRLIPMLRIFSISVPFASIHSCIMGYYLGQKKSFVPGFSQMIEQLARVLSVYFICQHFYSKNQIPNIYITALGLVIGEITASCFCLFILRLTSHTSIYHTLPQTNLYLTYFKKIISFSTPLTFSRLILTFFQSAEAIWLPAKLMDYGLSRKASLSAFGTLTGMVIPLLLAPSTLTTSFSAMLLPYVSEADAANNKKRIVSAFRKSLFVCSLLGFGCGIFFLLYGTTLGNLLFHSRQVGLYLSRLCYICPFLYMSSVLTSIMQGLGKTISLFFFQLIMISIRISFLLFSVPTLGLAGYFVGIGLSQIIFCILILIALKDFLYYNNTAF